MLVICCNQCHERLTDEGFDTYREADDARHRIGHPTGEITRHGEDEVICDTCYQALQAADD